MDLASEGNDDLIILDTSIRPLSRRPLFGHAAEQIVRNADTAVAVIASR